MPGLRVECFWSDSGQTRAGVKWHRFVYGEWLPLVNVAATWFLNSMGACLAEAIDDGLSHLLPCVLSRAAPLYYISTSLYASSRSPSTTHKHPQLLQPLHPLQPHRSASYSISSATWPTLRTTHIRTKSVSRYHGDPLCTASTLMILFMTHQ